MQYELRNENLSLEFEAPSSGYRGSRFDWMGKLVQITWADRHRFCTQQAEPDDPHKDRLGSGLFGEFGMTRPWGYDACQPGARFPKIGVGRLLRPDREAYDFTRPYDVVPYPHRVTQKEGELAFLCWSAPEDPFAFRYSKTFVLDKNGFRIRYRLENTGPHPIRTDEYIHNFIAIDGRGPGPGTTLHFSFSFEIDALQEVVNPGRVVIVGENALSWRKRPDSAFFFAPLGQNLPRAAWCLFDANANLGIREEVHFPVEKVNVWGLGHVVSAELFRRVDIAPGQTEEWERSYTIVTAKPHNAQGIAATCPDFTAPKT